MTAFYQGKVTEVLRRPQTLVNRLRRFGASLRL